MVLQRNPQTPACTRGQSTSIGSLIPPATPSWAPGTTQPSLLLLCLLIFGRSRAFSLEIFFSSRWNGSSPSLPLSCNLCSTLYSYYPARLFQECLPAAYSPTRTPTGSSEEVTGAGFCAGAAPQALTSEKKEHLLKGSV